MNCFLKKMNCRKHRKEIGKVAKKEKEKFPSLSESLFFLRFDKSGFTMIEMVIVLVIISVIIMLAYSQLRTPHEKAACQYIYSQMQLAKMNAVATGSNNTVDLDTLFDGYDDVDVPEDANFLASDPGSYPSGETAFPADGINFGTNNIVSFTSKGMAEESGSSDNGAAYIYDVNNSSRMCAVTVLSTGMIRLWTSIDSGATWS